MAPLLPCNDSSTQNHILHHIPLITVLHLPEGDGSAQKRTPWWREVNSVARTDFRLACGSVRAQRTSSVAARGFFPSLALVACSTSQCSSLVYSSLRPGSRSAPSILCSRIPSRSTSAAIYSSLGTRISIHLTTPGFCSASPISHLTTHDLRFFWRSDRVGG